MVALDWGLGDARADQNNAHKFKLSAVDRRFLICVLGALFLVRLLLIAWFPVTDSTEARYIEIARKMLVSNDWITPQFDFGVPFWGKPPLHTWLSALGMKMFGVGVFGGRIFIFAVSLGTIAIVFDWARRNRGTDQALAAITVLSSSLLFFGASAFVMTDMAMVLGTTLSMVAFYQCVRTTAARHGWGLLFFVGLAIGLMAKGPTAVVLTGIPIFLWVLVGNRWRLLRHLPWATGLLVLGLLTLPWYIAAELKTPGFLHYFIVGEHIQRFLVPGWKGDLYGSGHSRPKGMIWLFALADFFPWTFFATVLGVRINRVRQVVQNDDTGWYSYLGLWVVSPLILFTPAANILPAYVLPGIPAAAILLTTMWQDCFGGMGKTARLAAGGTLVSLLALYVTGAIISGVAPEYVTTRSEKRLVEQAHDIDPSMALTYWGRRSFSAEFYSRGSVQTTANPKDLRAMLNNDRRDAIAVPPAAMSQVERTVGPQFRDLGAFGRRHLLVEDPLDGDHS